MELALVRTISGLETRRADKVKGYDSFSIRGNSIGADIGYKRRSGKCVWWNVSKQRGDIEARPAFLRRRADR